MVCVIGTAAWEDIVSVVHPPRVGENEQAISLYQGPGGAGSATAAWVRSAGGQVRLVCGLGAEESAETIAQACLDAGIELLVSPLSSTPFMTIMIDEERGQRTTLSRMPHEGNIFLMECLGSENFAERDDVAWIDVSDTSIRGEFYERCKGMKVLPAEHALAEKGSGRTWTHILGEAHQDSNITDSLLEELGTQVVILGNASSGGKLWRVGSGWTTWGQPQTKAHLHISGTDDAFRGGVLRAFEEKRSIGEAIAAGAACAARCSLHVQAWPNGIS